jgi:hypothetical protein
MSLGDDFDPVLSAAQSGADWAIAILFRELNPLLLRFLRAQEPAHGDDLAAEVWLDAPPSWPSSEAGNRRCGPGCSPSPAAA